MYQYVYLSIDPGTKMLGTAINAITMDNQWVVLLAHTTNIELLLRHTVAVELINIHTERAFKSSLCGQVVSNYAHAWQVNQIVSESPYMGRFPAAFAALTECMVNIKQACMNYNPACRFVTIDPSTIKKMSGVKGNSGDKQLMFNAVTDLIGHYYSTAALDEHAIDAIAVGYAWYRSHWLGLQN